MNLLARASGWVTRRTVPSGIQVPRGGHTVVKGVSVTRPDVADLVAELQTFQQQFQRVFLALAEGLPGVSGAVQGLTAPFAELRDPERGLASQVMHEVSFIVERSRAAIATLLAQSELGLERSTALDGCASTLCEQLDSSLKLSQSLRLAGLNASFAVDGLGQQAAAFTAVNRALIDIADEAVKLAGTMGATAQQTREVAASIGLAQQTVTDAMRSAMADAEAGSQGVVVECGEVLAGVDGELADLTTRGHEVAAATALVMTAIQRQDILRQGLDHVIVVLGAMDDEFDRLTRHGRSTHGLMAFLTFQGQASRLIADLLLDLRAQLEALQASVERPVAGVGDAARAIGERSVDLELLASRLGCAADPVVLGLTTLPMYEAGVIDCESQVGQLEAQLHQMRPALKLLEKVPLQINVVAVLLKSEIARLDELSEASRITDELGEAGTSFSTLGNAAGDGVGAVAELATRLKGALHVQRGAWVGLHTLSADTEAPVARIQAIAGTFGQQLVGLTTAGQDIHRQTARLLADLAALREALALTDRLRAVCAEWETAAEAGRAALAEQGVEPAEASLALKALIDGFTVFAHKQIALGDVGPAPEQVSQPGELTLF